MLDCWGNPSLNIFRLEHRLWVARNWKRKSVTFHQTCSLCREGLAVFVSLCAQSTQTKRYVYHCMQWSHKWSKNEIFGGGMCESNALNHSGCDNRTALRSWQPVAFVSALFLLNYEMTDTCFKHLLKSIFWSDTKSVIKCTNLCKTFEYCKYSLNICCLKRVLKSEIYWNILSLPGRVD